MEQRCCDRHSLPAQHGQCGLATVAQPRSLPSPTAWLQVHSKIRANPVLPKKDRKKPATSKRWKTPKLTCVPLWDAGS